MYEDSIFFSKITLELHLVFKGKFKWEKTNLNQDFSSSAKVIIMSFFVNMFSFTKI